MSCRSGSRSRFRGNGRSSNRSTRPSVWKAPLLTERGLLHGLWRHAKLFSRCLNESSLAAISGVLRSPNAAVVRAGIVALGPLFPASYTHCAKGRMIAFDSNCSRSRPCNVATAKVPGGAKANLVIKLPVRTLDTTTTLESHTRSVPSSSPETITGWPSNIPSATEIPPIVAAQRFTARGAGGEVPYPQRAVVTA